MRGTPVRVKDGGGARDAVQSFRDISVAPKRFDEEILGVYLSCTNTRRLRGHWPLVAVSLSKDSQLPRMVGPLREDFRRVGTADLGE